MGIDFLFFLSFLPLYISLSLCVCLFLFSLSFFFFNSLDFLSLFFSSHFFFLSLSVSFSFFMAPVGQEDCGLRGIDRVPVWCSGLRIWYCHCSSMGGCRSVGLIPGLGAFTCCGCSQKKKKKDVLKYANTGGSQVMNVS